MLGDQNRSNLISIHEREPGKMAIKLLPVLNGAGAHGSKNLENSGAFANTASLPRLNKRKHHEATASFESRGASAQEQSLVLNTGASAEYDLEPILDKPALQESSQVDMKWKKHS